MNQNYQEATKGKRGRAVYVKKTHRKKKDLLSQIRRGCPRQVDLGEKKTPNRGLRNSPVVPEGAHTRGGGGGCRGERRRGLESLRKEL